MERKTETDRFATLHREEIVRRVVRRVAIVLELDDFGERLDSSHVQDGPSWEDDVFRIGCRQLGAYTKRLESLTAVQALDIVREGHVIVIPQENGEYTILERQLGRNVEITTVDGSQTHRTVPQSSIGGLLEESKSGVFMAQRELVCESLAAHDENDHHSHPPPLRRFLGLLSLESNDIWTVVLFALVSGILALATPLAAESLVNVVSWGTYVQPLAVLALILLASLGLAGVLKILQTVVVEIIQRRQFVRIVGDLAHRFPRAKRSYLKEHYPREMANRVFDIMTIQKATAVLLLDGVSIVLTTTLGLLLLSFYHPLLLGFNIVLLMAMISITCLLGRGGIQTSIDESIAKYRIVHWLQDVISFPGAFKINGGEELAIEKANSLAAEYLSARESQFRVVIRQVTFAIGLQVVASTALLGLGGWLVIGKQLTLGQLVASELVVTVVVGAFAKAGKSLEKFYDLMAGIDKVGHLLDIPVDRRRGQISLNDEPAALEWTDLQLEEGGNRCSVAGGNLVPGASLAVTGDNVVGRSMFADALAGIADPPNGVVTIAEMDATQAAIAGRGRLVAIANRVEVFHASVAENVELGRAGIGQDRLREVLKVVGLWDDIHQLSNGIDTPLKTEGYPLSHYQCVRLMLARAMAARPRMLVIDGLLDPFPESELGAVWASIQQAVAPCTIVVVTNRQTIVEACDKTIEVS
ncbi:ATP-binding cassette domain-containing protein [Planctomycetota bacterium]